VSWALNLSPHAAAAAAATAALPQQPAKHGLTLSVSTGSLLREEKRVLDHLEQLSIEASEQLPDGMAWVPDFSAYVAAAESKVAEGIRSDSSSCATSSQRSSVKTGVPAEAADAGVEQPAQVAAWAPDFSTLTAAWRPNVVEAFPPPLSHQTDVTSADQVRATARGRGVYTTAASSQHEEGAQVVQDRQAEDTSEAWLERTAAWAPDFSAYVSAAVYKAAEKPPQALTSHAETAAQHEEAVKWMPESPSSQISTMNATTTAPAKMTHVAASRAELEGRWAPDFSAYETDADSKVADSQPNMQELISAQSSGHFHFSDGRHYQPSSSTSASPFSSLVDSREPGATSPRRHSQFFTDMTDDHHQEIYTSRMITSISAASLRQRILSDHRAMLAAAAAAATDTASVPEYFKAPAVPPTPSGGATNFKSKPFSTRSADLSHVAEDGRSAPLKKVLATVV
jgi:hypothetical protein